MKKKALVTGGSGFLGTHLCQKLLLNDYKVICLDNFYTGCRQNVSKLLNNPNFDLIHHDICIPIDFEVDEIYNLACPASPVHYQNNPVQTVKTSVHGAINVLDLAKQKGAKVFQASTSEVYGDPTCHPQKETYFGNVNPVGIRSCYDESKRCAETLFFDYHRQYKVPIKVARIFNTYGPHMHPNDGRVVSNFIVQALRGEDITVYGDGLQTRSFCYVDDLINGFILLMNSNDQILGPINLGNPTEFTILELANLVIKYTNSSSKIIYKKLPLDDPKQRKPDITQAKKVLNWIPKIDLKEGLFKTIEYFKNLTLSDETSIKSNNISLEFK